MEVKQRMKELKETSYGEKLRKNVKEGRKEVREGRKSRKGRMSRK